MSKPINSLTEDKDLENLSNARDNTDNTVSHNLDKEENSTEKEVSDAHSSHHHHYHHNTDVIHDNGDGETFEVDWDTIERNYKHRHHHRSHSSGNQMIKLLIYLIQVIITNLIRGIFQEETAK